MAKAPIRLRLAKAILGSHAKEFIPSLSSFDGWGGAGYGGRLNDYVSKGDQLTANVGWCYAANSAIVDPASAVSLKLFRQKKNGEREEIFEHEILDLLNAPNLAHTGEQLRQLHFTYMNFVGESYIYMRRGDTEFIPSQGKLPYALDIFPAHQVSFSLGETYTKSTIRYGQDQYPLMSFIRDLNPDPARPYYGRSIIRAAALTIDTENQMKEWNRSIFANNARPGLIFRTDEPLSDESYQRWKQQFIDEHTGTENAHKPLLIEGGDAKPYMLNQQDLDFMNSRKFSRDEILAMWRVSPAVLGAVENVNRSNLEAGFYIHAMVNVLPRIRQFVKQLNATLVKVYDPLLELDFENPVPEDVEAKLSAAKAGTNTWWTIDETRAMYGDKPLPHGLGSKMIVIGKGAVALEDVVNGKPAPDETTSGDETKALARKLKKIGDVVAVQCNCCDGVGEHDTGFECYRCDAGGWCTPDEDKAPIPCGGRKDSPDVWVDQEGRYRHTEEKKSFRYKQVSAGQFPGLYDDLDIDLDKLGCIMMDTETLAVTQFVEDGEADLIHEPKSHKDGAVAETEAHVTLLFGLLENGNVWKDKVDTVLGDWDLEKLEVKDVTSFDLGDHYAVVALIKKTPELVDGHERLTLLPHIQTFSEYKPHLTLAYVDHDKAVVDKWVAALRAEYKGKIISTRGINYGDKPDTTKSVSSLAGVRKKT